jgi:hypothetical protein
MSKMREHVAGDLLCEFWNDRDSFNVTRFDDVVVAVITRLPEATRGQHLFSARLTGAATVDGEPSELGTFARMRQTMNAVFRAYEAERALIREGNG